MYCDTKDEFEETWKRYECYFKKKIVSFFGFFIVIVFFVCICWDDGKIWMQQ